MTPFRVLSPVVFLLLAALPAYADGTVLRAKGCGDKVFVSGNDTYSVLVASDPGAVKDGDKLVGNTDRLGFSSFLTPESGRRFSASVDERGLTKSEITQRIAATCHAATGNRLTSGQVERAAGCGNKIFVNTAQGYAVLERLAGGLVYAGDTLTGDFSRPGRVTVMDGQTHAELVVFVDDFQLPKSAAQRKITESCR
ncbi:MAG TPA: hypothetical protein VG308_17820 [Stellaceae bacterium]|jgi:hypothetical protein|nr:hypothetical protein [Stellaceae bacterium]